MTHNTNPIATAGVHPGLNLKAELATRGIKQNELAADIGIQPSQLNEVLKGKRPITPDFALLIGAALNINPERWIQLQANYNLNLARIEVSNQEKIKEINEWQKIKSFIDVPYLRKQGELIGTLSTDIKKLLKIYSFSSVEELTTFFKSDNAFVIHYRKSSKLLEHKLAIQTWVGYVKYLSVREKISGFKFECQEKLMADLKKVFLGKKVLENLTKSLNSNGISLIISEKPDKAPIDGATFWHENKPVIAITLRHKRFDNLLFTIYHELGHIFLHMKDDKQVYFVDNLEDKDRTAQKEEEANAFARNILIPEEEWDKFVNRHQKFSDIDMKRFADSVSVPVVSVWGRLCFENRISYSSPSAHRNHNDIP